jgi:hypothetical protein
MMFTLSCLAKSLDSRVPLSAILAWVVLQSVAGIVLPEKSQADVYNSPKPISQEELAKREQAALGASDWTPRMYLVVSGVLLVAFEGVCFAGLLWSRKSQQKRLAEVQVSKDSTDEPTVSAGGSSGNG